MRLPFNTTCDVFGGPGSIAPGVLLGTFACRFVIADGIFLVGVNAPTRVGWITLQGIVPSDCFSPPLLSMDPALANQVAVPSGTAPQFYNLMTEEVNWKTQPIYYRMNLVYLPRPHPGHDGLQQEDFNFILNEDTGFIYLDP